MVLAAALDLTSRESIAAAFRATVDRVRRLRHRRQHRRDLSDAGRRTPPEDDVGAGDAHQRDAATTCSPRRPRRCCKAQGLPASIVLTSSANAVVPKPGSEPYDVSKAAINHLIRELAIGLGPLVRVNGIAPATVVAGSAMFPRDRVIVSLKKYRSRSTSRSRPRAARQAGGVLRAAHDHAPADSADRLRQRDLLAGRRSERQDDRARDSGRWRVAGGVSALAASINSSVTQRLPAAMQRVDSANCRDIVSLNERCDDELRCVVSAVLSRRLVRRAARLHFDEIVVNDRLPRRELHQPSFG